VRLLQAAVGPHEQIPFGLWLKSLSDPDLDCDPNTLRLYKRIKSDETSPDKLAAIWADVRNMLVAVVEGSVEHLHPTAQAYIIAHGARYDWLSKRLSIDNNGCGDLEVIRAASEAGDARRKLKECSRCGRSFAVPLKRGRGGQRTLCDLCIKAQHREQQRQSQQKRRERDRLATMNASESLENQRPPQHRIAVAVSTYQLPDSSVKRA